MAAFGWSAGDIVASVQLVGKIAGSLKETNGAKSNYRESIDFLFGLEITLQNLRTIGPVIVTPSQQDIIQFETEKIVKPLSDFFAKVQKFDATLGTQSHRGGWRTAPRKIHWALGVSKEVQTLRERISVPLSSLNILLQSQTLHAISQLKERLPGDISDRIASSIDSAVSKSLQHELKTLKHTAKKYAEIQETLGQNSVSSIIISDQDSSRAITREQRKQTHQASRDIAAYVNPQEVEDAMSSCPTRSRLEQLIHDQSNDIKSLSMSLTTLIESQGLPRNQSSEENVVSLRTSILELKVLFAKCMCLLALNLREFFNQTLLYLGPQFLFFLMALRQFWSTMPRLLLGDSILFEDVLGRRKYLPVDFFQHYSVFSSFLRESFEGVPGQKYVLNQQYRLNDVDNDIVDSGKWRQTVIRRSKVTMSVVLDYVNDVEMACPRCWTSERSSKPGANIQCSTCALIYRAPDPENSPRGEGEQMAASVEGPSSINNGAEATPAGAQSEISGVPDSEEWGRTTVTNFSTTLNRSSPSEGWLGDTRNTSGLPWDYEELAHFKRVQIAEPNSMRLSQLSAFFRLVMVSARLNEEVLKTSSIDQPKTILDTEIDELVSLLKACSDGLSPILRHPFFELLSRDTISDGTAPLWSQAWTDSTQLQQQSKALSREALRVCQYLEKVRSSKQIWGDFEQDSAMRDKVKLASSFYTSLHVFSRALNTLAEVDIAWTHGGRLISRQIESPQNTQSNTEFEGGVPTSLEVTSSHIVVALDSGNISIFNRDGSLFGTLGGHIQGVWAMASRDDILVTGGLDRFLRVWRISTRQVSDFSLFNGDSYHVLTRGPHLFRQSLHALRGHTSTIRCLKFINSSTVVSGSRDTTLRVWDLEHGLCKHVLAGHQASVRCLDTKGDVIVSGSYDNTARVWSASEGRCLMTLAGHYSQIYCVAFDGQRVVTGSLDTSVRVWDISTGTCQAILQGHTSLVGQLQLRQDTLVTGGSDGSVRVWSLEDMTPMHRLAAADNSITSLRFDHRRILTGASDGRVKVWDLRTGELIRELGQPADAVWKVHLEETLAVTIRTTQSSGPKIVIEIWSFLDDVEEDYLPFMEGGNSWG